MLLLSYGQLQSIGKTPARPEFRESIVFRIEIGTTDGLGVQSETLKHLSLEAEAGTTIFPGAIFAQTAIGVVVLTMITTEQPELLQCGIVFIPIEQT